MSCRLERGPFTLGLNFGKKRESSTGAKTNEKQQVVFRVLAQQESGRVFFFLFPPPETRAQSFPLIFTPAGSDSWPHPPRSQVGSRPAPSLPLSRGSLCPTSPAQREAVAAAVTCPGSRQVRPLLRRSDSQMVRQEELQPRPLSPSRRGSRRLLASPKGSD